MQYFKTKNFTNSVGFDKIKSVYESYINRNKDTYNDVIKSREKYHENNFSVLTNEKGNPVYFASNNNSLQVL